MLVGAVNRTMREEGYRTEVDLLAVGVSLEGFGDTWKRLLSASLKAHRTGLSFSEASYQEWPDK